jgi:DNA invertase Pin-like site-specific DNA recombinase
MLRTACYVRVSTDKDEQKDSLQNQQNQFLQFIKGTELVLHDFYVDIESGTKEGRENFLRMLADAESGEVQVIVAKELTRFVSV